MMGNGGGVTPDQQVFEWETLKIDLIMSEVILFLGLGAD